MAGRDIELALKKQRLLMESAALRDEMALHGRGLTPAFAVADLARQGWQWLKARPAIPVAIGVALIVARPAAMWRWGRRVWLAWQGWQRWRPLLGAAVAKRENP